MSASSPELTAETPLAGVYPFNAPGESVTLYDGPVAGPAGTEVPGVVQYDCSPKLGISWRLHTEDYDVTSMDRTALSLLDLGFELPVLARDAVSGWCNGAFYGDPAAALDRVVAHWFNLPRWRGSAHLAARADNGTPRLVPAGRSVYEADGWKITLDIRPDHEAVFSDVRQADIYVMTHVMEIRRCNGATFTADEVTPVLSALRVGLSFALGRLVAPALPVGRNRQQETVWGQWGPMLCDPARRVSSGWWYPEDQTSLADLLACLLPAFRDPDRGQALSLQMQYAITAIADRGFVEQRIMSGAAGLEHVMWQELVLSGRLTETEYSSRAWPAHIKLRTLLTDAGVDLGVRAEHLPAAAAFAAGQQVNGSRSPDGADVATRVRNRLVHPKETQEPVYAVKGLVTDTWLLTRHYLALLVLHSIGYRGSYKDLSMTNGWVGETEPVPWL
ncbi:MULTISPECIES: hypothetical protein [Streptomyces]|uniref:hypothetical protein n=1 Tax=Streptomyces TaxID=1883 RepID=UPI001675DA31|nr:hypothetical protein [Streptomyces purpurascens]MCE7047056.1 hypothetical protein [Streptomyces purpurascens]GHA03626.1 hypothetical protein GCM10010303_11450 [Streptomyces purpurascens]